MRLVDILELGIKPHNEVDELMRNLQRKRICDEINDTLLICEHKEIVTVGPRARNDGIKPPDDYKTADVDRGGGLTWHGPGQLVIYPVFKWNLDGESNVQKIIQKLEEWVIQSLLSLNISCGRDDRMQGVWCGESKFCSIGLSFLRWTSRHGLTINYDTPPGRVEMVSGCGLGQHTTTSLSALGYHLTKESIVSKLISNLHILSRKNID